MKYIYLTWIPDLYPQYIKNFYNSIRRPKSIYKIGKRFEQQTKENIQIANKHMQICELLFLIGKINTKMINCYRFIRMAKIKEPYNFNCGPRMWKN